MSRATLLMLAVASTPCWFATDCVAVTKTWTGGSGNWSPGNWSPAGVPVAGDPTRIVFTDGVARTVTLNTNTPSLGLVSIDLTGAGSAESSLSITSSNTLTAGGLLVGGHNGVTSTSGRGSVTQSAGTVNTSPGLDLVLADGAGSTGTYSLSGTGAIVASQSLYVGLRGTGVFNHSGGTNTINAGAIGSFDVGVFTGSSGTYNLSGTGQLISNKSEYVGDQGTGAIYQTGGTNTITGANSLYLGFSAGGSGTYAISGGTLNVGNDLIVGNAGSGNFNVSGTAVASIADNVTINSTSNLNLTGGTLRLDRITGINRMNFIGGTLQLAGNRTLTDGDSIVSYFFGSNPILSGTRRLIVEGTATVGTASGATFSVSGTQFSSNGRLTVGEFAAGRNIGTIDISNGAVVTNAGVVLGRDEAGVPVRGAATVSGVGTTWTTGDLHVGEAGEGSLWITGGAHVVSDDTRVGLGDNSLPSSVVVSDAGSTLTANNLNLGNGYARFSTLTVNPGALVSIGGTLRLSTNCTVTLDGGTLRFNTLTDEGDFRFNAGTIQLGGARNVGSDVIVAELFGAVPTVPTGKGLTIEGAATLSRPLSIAGGTFKANAIAVASGGFLDFDRGVLELAGGTITGLSQLNVPTNGEFRASGLQAYRVAGAAGSTIAATGALSIGDLNSVAGFGTQGDVIVGANLVDLLDANDAVLGSLSLVTLGAGGSPGMLNTANGLTLEFGANITGFGTVGNPNLITKSLINNGHITGSSSAQPITLPGYVKGVGTFDNVVFQGTYSPGLSPTSQIVGSIGLADTGTLLMEIGGTSPGSGHDQVLASGDMRFDGVLEVQLLGGFTPTAGQAFNLFDWGTVNGTFDTLTLPALAGGLAWNTSQLYTAGVLSVVSAGLPGDYNSDGQVNAADYTTWRDNLGSATALPNDDTPGVGPEDFTRWVTNYGSATATSSAASIPEPCAALLSLVVFAGMPKRRRR